MKGRTTQTTGKVEVGLGYKPGWHPFCLAMVHMVQPWSTMVTPAYSDQAGFL